MARTRETFGTHANMAHVWAQQNQTHGRSSDGRMLFDGPAVYSYGRHFTLARFTEVTVGGARLVLENADGYSVSTSKHFSHVRRALSGLDVIVIRVPRLTDIADNANRLTVAERGAVWRALVGRRDMEAVAAWRAWLKASGVKAPTFPRDAAAWLARLDAADKKAALRDKITNARRVAGNARYEPDLPDPAQSARTIVYRLETELSRTRHELTMWRSARNVLMQHSAAKALVARLRTAIRDATEAVPRIEGALADARRAESHSRRVEAESHAYNHGVPDWTPAGTYADHYATALEVAPERAAHWLNKMHGAAFTHWHANAYYVAPSRTRTAPITPDQWCAGVGTAHFAGDAPTMLRRVGGRLETSRGAVAPWTDAARAWPLLQNVMHRAVRADATWTRCAQPPITLGAFTIDVVRPDGAIRAGCHTLEYAEVLRLAIREIPHTVRPTYPLPAVIQTTEA